MVTYNLCRDIYSIIFPEFPREVIFVRLPGSVSMDSRRKARKRMVRSFNELSRLLMINNGIYDIYTRLYVNNTINKLFFDIDAEDIRDAYSDAVELCKVLERENLLYIPVFSGKKGFHIYVVSQVFKYTNDELPLAKHVVASIQKYFIDEARLKHVDKHFIGSLTHLARIPNTRRDNQRYSIYLLQKFWMKYELPEIIEMSYTQKCYSIENYVGEKLNLYEYVASSFYDDIVDDDNGINSETTLPEIRLHDRSRNDIYVLLKEIVRPCILNYVFTDEPDHDIRTFFVLELKYYLFSQKEVEEIISKLGWRDYDYNITHYHVSKLYEKNLYPPKCSTIREKGYCLGKKCIYYPGLFLIYK